MALMDKSAPLAVTVDRFASEWVPPGGLKVSICTLVLVTFSIGTNSIFLTLLVLEYEY